MLHRLSCSAGCAIFPGQGLNPCPLHWHADSQPLDQQGRPFFYFITFHVQLKQLGSCVPPPQTANSLRGVCGFSVLVSPLPGALALSAA